MSSDDAASNLIVHTLTAEGHDASEDGRGVPLVTAFDTTQITSPGNYSQPNPGEPCHPLAKGAHPPCIAFQTSGYGAQTGDIVPTLQASFDRLSNQVTGIIQPNAGVRRLSPLECLRLFALPDDYLDGLGLSDSAKYRMLGNSVVTTVTAWLGERIVNATGGQQC